MSATSKKVSHKFRESKIQFHWILKVRRFNKLTMGTELRGSSSSHCGESTESHNLNIRTLEV